MKNLRYAASVVAVLASIFFVGCGNQVGETLENSILSVSLPKGWSPAPISLPEKFLSMVSSNKGHEPRLVVLLFGSKKPGKKDSDLFEIIKRDYERNNKIDSERMQKVAGRDALRLEITKTDDEGKVTRSIVVAILLDDSTVTIRSQGSPDAMDAVKDQFEEIIDSIKLK